MLPGMLNPRKVRQRRDELQLSQAEAAKAGDLNGRAQAWSNIEGGRVTDIRLSTLTALARGLQCSVADLIDEDYPPTRKRK